ncbi:MAG: hypothetical protein ABIT23_01230 [Nitrosospira sp.]
MQTQQMEQSVIYRISHTTRRRQIMTKYRRNFLKGGGSFFGATPADGSQGPLANQVAALWAAFHHVIAIHPSGVKLSSYATGAGLKTPRKRLP